MPFSWKNPLKALPVLLLLAVYAGAAFGVAGNVQFVFGDVKLTTRAGVTMALRKGADVNEGDRVVTSDGASAQIKMVDGGFIAIRPNTDMGFDTYRYNGKEDGTENAIVSLVRGGFRTITGIIGRTNKQNYLVKTATATIGIRGTDHEPVVILAPRPGQAAIAAPGTYDKVNVGIAFIRNDAGSIDIQRNQVGFAPETKAAPVILPRIPPFYKPTPAPGPQKAKQEAKDEGKKEAAPGAAAPAEKSAEAPAQVRDTAVVDPVSTVSAAPASAPIAVAPVVEITATGASGATLNTTTQTVTTSSGATTPITEQTPTVTPPPVTPPPVTPVDVTNFASTAVLRHDVLWATTQIEPGANPATTTYIVSDKTNQNLFNNASGTPATPLTTPLTTPVALTGPTNNTNFVFDASGNLTKVLDTTHVVFDLGNDVPGSATRFAAPTPLAHAQLSFGGGAIASENYYDAATNIRLGRWSGGVINLTDLSTGSSYVESLLAPGGAARSAQWIVVQVPSSLPLTGEFHYTRINDSSGTASFATAPTDSYGNVGTLDGARLSADFTKMKASAAFRITMPSGPAGSFGMQNLSARFDNAPISNGGFNVSSSSSNPAGTDNLHIGCFGRGCAPDITLSSGSIVSVYGGRIRGGFDSATGNAGTADGAFFRYTLDTLYGAYGVAPPAGRVVDDYISGLVAFKQGPQIALPTSAFYPVAAPTGPVVVIANYGYNTAAGDNFSSGQAYWVDRPPGNLVTDAAGNLVSLVEDNTMQGDGRVLALSGGTANPATPIALAIGSTATATDGTILLGWQASSPNLTVSGIQDNSGCFGSGCALNPPPRTVLGDGLSWVRGAAPFPNYLPSAIAGYTNSGGVVVPGTATYDLGASILHDQSGAAGTVNSAGLTVNFSNANVAFNMAAATAAGNWTAAASGIKLNQNGSFYAYSGGPRTLTSGTTVAPTGLHDGLNVTFAPAAGTATNTWGNIQGQLMGIGVAGAGLTYNLNSFLPCTIGPCNNVRASGALAFGLTPSQQPYSTLTPYHLVAFATGMNAAGQLYSQENHRIQGGFLSSYRTQTVDNYPVKIDGELPVVVTYSSPCTINCGPFINDIPVVYTVAGASGPASIGTATVLESGFDLSSGIRWGRYGGGTIGVNDRISGASLGTLDATRQNVHFVMTSNQSGPTVLPLSGTFNYTFAGGTAPTDSNGNVGAALTAANASLTANFSTQKVDATLSNLVLGGNTWGASATGMPIQGNVFQADKKPGGGGNLTVTSTLGTNTTGSLAGVFTGATGNGVGMLYSLNHGGNSVTNPAAVTVSGVAVFRR